MERIKRNINLLGITLLMVSFFAFSGFNCEEGGIELRVVGTATTTAIGGTVTDGNFSGYYIVDGGSVKSISGTLESNGFYRFSTNLGTFKQIEISVTKDNPRATMDIYLYDQNGDVIQKINNASCDAGPSTCTNSSAMSYTFAARQ